LKFLIDLLTNDIKEKKGKKKKEEEGESKGEGRRGGFRAGRRNRRSGGRTPPDEGKVEIFAFTVRQRRGLTPDDLRRECWRKRRVRLHVRGPPLPSLEEERVAREEELFFTAMKQC
jgi:hypothetical protein